MEELLRDYGSTGTVWIWLVIAILIAAGGVALSIAISKGKFDLPRVKIDRLRYVSWAIVFTGVLIALFTLADGEITFSQNNMALEQWNENGYYVENYGEIEERDGETIQVKEGAQEATELKADYILIGCDRDVYAEVTNGEVWICVSE
ncbi:hypothetical protein SAMN05216353_10458 [Halobacillus alkaliphilus]|uniref:Uncharacterized protein n=1 Tax=Halobacillus alkaliphilus TaxID=396056 RepID=A0A1I2KHK7_9BACI|nr:hypothetical protein [Halobacillus alkaliphilus]SFF64591.1 hypothetical protein SAMN05216353_10458 [Halobacillus alkaliphilus]